MESAFSRVKARVSEQYCWYFLLAVFFIPVLIDNWKLVTNLYRVWICIPILLCIRWKDFRLFIQNRFVQLFMLMTAWFSLSLAWSPDDSKVVNMLTRILATCALLYLTWLISHYQPDKLVSLGNYYLFSALCLILLLAIFRWESIITLDRNLMAFGAFFKPGPLAVFFSAAALMSLFLAGTKKNLSLVYIALMVVFFVCTIITQSRSGLLMFASGAIAYLLLERSQKSLLIFLVVTALCTLSLATIYFYNPDPILDLWERKDAQRFLIYQNGFSMITESPLTTVIGHGLAIDKLIPYSSHFETHIHMLYMNIVFQTGLIGLLLFLFTVGWRFYNIIFKRTPYNSWDIILIGMLVAFLFDGNKFYVYPGGTMAAFLLPLFITNLVPERIMADKVKF